MMLAAGTLTYQLPKRMHDGADADVQLPTEARDGAHQ
jgi:hypothetical protein